MYGSSDRGWEFRDSKTCIYPYEARDASALARAGGYETPRGSVSTLRDCHKAWWPLVQEGMQMGPQ